MAKANNKTAIFLNLALMLSLLLMIISAAESRILGGHAVAVGFERAKSTPQCDLVIGVRSGDTCFGITQLFNLTTEFFDSINPNVNCTGLFVGQWLCVAGSAN